MYHGMTNHMGNLTLLSGSVSRSISPENFTGAKGAGAQCELEDGSAKWAARDLGKGWKVNPYIRVAPGETFEIANIQAEQAKWLTTIINFVAMMAMCICDIEYFMAIMAIYVTILFISVLIDEKTTAEFAAYSFVLVCMIGMALRCVMKFYSFDDDGFLLMIYVAIATFLCDTGAYFFGVFFGKHKLIPRVSPNKTWEGSIGGYITGAITSGLFGLLVLDGLDASLILTGALTLPLIAQVGDLGFSSIKRHFGIKDFGSFLPGHGGVLDRVDSLIFCLMWFHALMILWGVL